MPTLHGIDWRTFDWQRILFAVLFTVLVWAIVSEKMQESDALAAEVAAGRTERREAAARYDQLVADNAAMARDMRRIAESGNAAIRDYARLIDWMKDNHITIPKRFEVVRDPIIISSIGGSDAPGKSDGRGKKR